MVSIEKFRKSLGKTANKLSEEEILRLREIEDKIADAVFDSWLRKRNNVTSETYVR